MPGQRADDGGRKHQAQLCLAKQLEVMGAALPVEQKREKGAGGSAWRGPAWPNNGHWHCPAALRVGGVSQTLQPTLPVKRYNALNIPSKREGWLVGAATLAGRQHRAQRGAGGRSPTQPVGAALALSRK
ncbi:hypothetical protein L7F22_013530 [Adiantum nelumboides]|nr:hypothetical protein [Adiantum nelumboides]